MGLLCEDCPLIWSTRKLEVVERTDLLAYNKEFGELFIKNTTKNPTPKMHSLFTHCEYSLHTYGSVGLFAEDSIEVIHAMVNRIVGVLQSLDGDRQTNQVLHFLSAESDRTMK
jgi:hypothetical protein